MEPLRSILISEPFLIILTLGLGYAIGRYLNDIIDAIPQGFLIYSWKLQVNPNVECLGYYSVENNPGRYRRKIIVPLLTSGLMLLLTLKFMGRLPFDKTYLDLNIEFYPVYLLALCGMIVISVIDFEHMIVPNQLSLGGVVGGLIASLIYPDLHGETIWFFGLWKSALGGIMGFFIIWILAIAGKKWFGREAIGTGDAKLFAALGALLGAHVLLPILMGASILGFVIGLPSLWSKYVLQKSNKSAVLPWAPSICIVAYFWLLYGTY